MTRPNGSPEQLLEAEGRGETLGEAKWAAVNELRRRFQGVAGDDVEFEVLDEPGPDGGEAAVRASLDIDRWKRREKERALPGEPVERVREALARILAGLDIRATVSVEDGQDSMVAEVYGSDLAVLIGRHGRTIDAAQLLVGQIAFKGMGTRKRVVVDAAGYRQRRRNVVERDAKKAADQAVRFARAVELAPMSSGDRKTVHLLLDARADVETHSEGQGPHRRVVVTPIERRVSD